MVLNICLISTILFSQSIEIINDGYQIEGKILSGKSIQKITLKKINTNFDYELKLIDNKPNSIDEHIIDTLNFGVLNKISFIDLNDDKNNDILIETTDNKIKSYCYVYVKAKSKITFNKISNSEDYGSIKRLEGSSLYFSYKSIGCADNYWKSFLIKFKDKKIVLLGEIFGDFCGENDQKKITIKKIGINEVISIEEICHQEFKTQMNNKFSFIKSYWLINKNQFEN